MIQQMIGVTQTFSNGLV